MKQCFTHRLPSHVTLLSDPWPEDFSGMRDKIEQLAKTSMLVAAVKNAPRRIKPKAD
jgi:hypothetical protein